MKHQFYAHVPSNHYFCFSVWFTFCCSVQISFCSMILQKNIMLNYFERVKCIQYLLLAWCFENACIFPHSSCSLNAFCRVCCLAQISHSASGSSHVLQKYIAVTFLPSWIQGSHNVCSSCCESTLKQIVNIKFIFLFTLRMNI